MFLSGASQILYLPVSFLNLSASVKIALGISKESLAYSAYILRKGKPQALTTNTKYYWLITFT